MNLNNTLLLVLAVILLGIRLPSFMTRLGMSKKDKIATVIIMFSLLGFVWFFVYIFTRFI